MIAPFILAMLAVAGAAPAAVPEPDTRVMVLDHGVEAGAQLTVADLVEQAMSPSAARGALRGRDIDGMEAARRLGAGAIVRSTDLVRPQLVRRGEPVTITVRSGGLVISTTGRALASGAAGAAVRVVATTSNRTLDGVVDGPGLVRIMSN